MRSGAPLPPARWPTAVPEPETLDPQGIEGEIIADCRVRHPDGTAPDGVVKPLARPGSPTRRRPARHPPLPQQEPPIMAKPHRGLKKANHGARPANSKARKAKRKHIRT